LYGGGGKGAIVVGFVFGFVFGFVVVVGFGVTGVTGVTLLFLFLK
jgi:hypothetical protein